MSSVKNGKEQADTRLWAQSALLHLWRCTNCHNGDIIPLNCDKITMTRDGAQGIFSDPETGQQYLMSIIPIKRDDV